MKLRPKTGIEDFVFGLSDYKIIRRLGTPDLIEEAWNNHDELIYQYFDIKTSFSFFLSNNRKLGTIRTSNESLTFNNQQIIGNSLNIVQNEILKSGSENWRYEPSEFHQNFYSETLNIALNVKYNVVFEIEIYPDLTSPLIKNSALVPEVILERFVY